MGQMAERSSFTHRAKKKSNRQTVERTAHSGMISLENMFFYGNVAGGVDHFQLSCDFRGTDEICDFSGTDKICDFSGTDEIEMHSVARGLFFADPLAIIDSKNHCPMHQRTIGWSSFCKKTSRSALGSKPHVFRWPVG
jgi:hypothetical protein